jgi:hypothetical protein
MNPETAIGFAAIDRRSLEDAGTLLILHYKPMPSMDAINIDSAHAYTQELEANPEFVQLATGCEVMVLPCHGLLSDLFSMINMEAPAPAAPAPKLSGLVDASGNYVDNIRDGTNDKSSVITGDGSLIPIGAQAIIASMGMN